MSDSLPQNSSDSPVSKPKRRPRYSGKNPRHFHEKYKELNPEKYPETLQKILASGKTPAGMHRPILLNEILEALAPKPGEIAVDCTLGFGGHASEILKRILPGGKLIGLDVDVFELPKTEARLRELDFPAESLAVEQSNFAGLPKVLAGQQISGADLILADLGCSSMQFDNPERGFSFKFEGPLDLRMNPNKGRPAHGFLASLDEASFAEILVANSDEPYARVIAQVVFRKQKQIPITTTTQLANAVREAIRTLPKQVQQAEGDAPIRRVFQALRIAVNEEFTALETFLRVLPNCLNPGGRVAILTFHSGEDRRVKKAFQEGLRSGVFSQISEDVIRPTPEEKRANPRSTSAKLRWAVRAKI